MNHRDHVNAVLAKRMQEDLDDDNARRIEELLAADQQKQHEQPVYREPGKEQS